MTFKELLKELQQKNLNIKVGSQTSFFYCGKAKNLTLDLLEKLGNKFFESFERKEASQRKNLAKLKRSYKTVKDEKKKEKIKASIKRAETYHNNTIKIIAGWSPLSVREVEYCIDGICPDEPKTKVVKIAGYEVGKYWTIEEYNKKIERKNKKTNEKKNVKLRFRELRIVQRKLGK